MRQPVWGQWSTPEAELGLLPPEMAGMTAIDLGCGTGYVSGWMARRNAKVVGIDCSVEQLMLARQFADEHAVSIELVGGSAEQIPMPGGSFDFAISEFGAATWSDPVTWIPEAWRVLRPGGDLVVLSEHPLLMICLSFAENEPASDHLVSSYFGIRRFEWHDGEDRAVNFNLPVSGWVSLFLKTGFEIVAYHEIQAPEPGRGRSFNVTADWAHRWPSEQVWKVRRP